MKKKLLATAFLSVIVCHANAQSSVTLYGVLDTGLLFVNNSGGGSLYGMSAGNQQGNRWGLRGSEDIGGGLSVVFVLENGFSILNGRLGQGGDEFGRQAYVGLSSRYGTVTLGRQYDSVVDYTGVLEVGSQWGSFYAAHPGDLDNLNNTNRVNNAIKYTSQNLSGFKFGGLYSLGGVAGKFNTNQIWSGGISYANGPLNLAAAYLNVKNPNFSFFGNNSASSTTASNMTGSQVYSGFASAKTQEVVAVGGAYTFGAATLGGVYTNTQFRGLGQTAVTGLPAGAPRSGNAKFHNFEANFKYQVTPSFLVGAAYNYTKGYGVSDQKIHQGVIGADYFLSKRTDFYADVVYQHASGTNSIGAPATAQINGLSASTTQNQVAAVVGVRHKF